MTSKVDKLRDQAAQALRGVATRSESDSPPDIAGALKEEQFLMHDLRVIMDNGVAVIVPPLYHEVRTLKLRVRQDARALQQAQRQLEQSVKKLERQLQPRPDGLGITIAWGLAYFWTYVPGPSFHYLPVDNAFSITQSKALLAVQDAIRFPSDPDDVILEDNDALILLRSDSPDHIAEGARTLFDGSLDFWEVTSIRKGFIGGGYEGQQSLPKKMAIEAGIPGAAQIPDTAQLFMGFTSSQKAALGGEMIANFESIPGLTDQWPNGYFRHGCAMHLSHLFEDLEGWYGRFSYEERVARGFKPGLDAVAPGTQTIPQGPYETMTHEKNVSDLEQHHVVGHSAALHPATRLPTDLVDNYGNFYPRGTAIPQRADFNTLDNPFHWTSNPERDHWSDSPAAGLHFLVFVPVSAAFHRGRLAMDGHYEGSQKLNIDPRSPHQGMNSFLRTTHRQNFLVPPRSHRSFPLAEMA